MHFRSIRDPIDTSTPQGMFSLQVLGAVAQLERALIAERTKAGIKAAKARAKLPGNPGLRERPPEAIKSVSKARAKRYLDELIASAQTWLPMVRLRPHHSWDNVVRVLNRRGHDWTVERAWCATSSRKRPPGPVPSPCARRPSDEAGSGDRHCRSQSVAPRHCRPIWIRWENGLCAAARNGSLPPSATCWTKPTDMASSAIEGAAHQATDRVLPLPTGSSKLLTIGAAGRR